MRNDRSAYYFLIFCLGATGVLLYFIAEPFLSPLILAAVFALFFQPLYKRFLRLTGQRASLAALVTTVIAALLILIPVMLVGTMIFREASDLYQNISKGDDAGFLAWIESGAGTVRDILPIPEGFSLDIGQYVRQGLEVVVSKLGIIFSSFLKVLLSTFVFLVTFYFILKDGRGLKNYLVELSPLADNDDKLIIRRFKEGVAATVKGNLTIGLIQGALTAVGFAIFGVPSAVLWGSVAAVAALIPGLGTAIVILPGIIYLFLSGSTPEAIGLLIWGVLAVGLIDNFLLPKLVGQGMHLHPLAVFLSVLGGLALFGPIGFLLGPLAVSVGLALVDIYLSLRKKTD